MRSFWISTLLTAGLVTAAVVPAWAHTQKTRVAQAAPSLPQDQAGRFTAAILGNTEEVWREVLPRQVNQQYRPPRLVLFSQGTLSGCGAAQSAMGPFYCPLDQTVYIDPSLLEDMQRRSRAGGDFAYAYVIAQQVGYHIENQLGILARIQARQHEVGEDQRRQLFVRVELMADCLAGVWAHHSHKRGGVLKDSDIEEALRAAHAVSNERSQSQPQGGSTIPPSNYSSAEQRVRWFMQGRREGEVRGCDTFRAGHL